MKISIPSSWRIVVPLFQGGETAKKFLLALNQILTFDAWIIVNDGSTDGLPQELEALGLPVIHQPQNGGKAQALLRGIREAQAVGAEWVLTMDADGQHAADDLGAFVQFYSAQEMERIGVIVGQRHFSQTMPWPRVISNSATTFLLGLIAGHKLFDSQCGYRLYQISALNQCPTTLSQGFQWESEILFRIARQNWEIHSVPVQTIYGDEVSSIHPWRDTWRFISLWWALLLGF